MEQHKVVQVRLGELVERFAAYPFRGRIEASEGGVLALQMKDVSEDGVNWSSVVQTTLTGKKAPVYVEEGDLLMLAKGTHQYALVFSADTNSESMLPVVCSPQFFHLRVQDNERVDSNYLAMILNSPLVQNQLKSVALGSMVKTLRSEDMVALSIPLPPLAVQQELVSVQRNLKRQKQIYQQLISNGEQLLNGLISQISTGALQPNAVLDSSQKNNETNIK